MYCRYLDGRELVPSAQCTIHQPQPNRCQLHLKPAQPGTYLCIARNQFGEARSVGKIIVESR